MDENRMQVACGQQETIDALVELKGRFERGELNAQRSGFSRKTARSRTS